MSDPSSNKDGFHALWPTTLLRRRLPGAANANKELLRLIRALEADHAALTTDYRSDNLLVLDNPAVGWLKDCINKTVIDYLRHQGLDYPVNWSLHGWANINRLGDYHDPHNHPHAYLSGTYYVAVPQARAALKSRADVRPGCITFYDPRGATNMGAIRGDGEIEAEYTVRPEPGLILLWPAFLKHFVHPNLSDEERVSISFNAMLKWSDAYLPQQS
ncbi:MAG: 2OG-Fe(II) oxygenase family protein [Kiloniellales bacterium]|nr:2OG-Fe(II) oxygenase family protein [Kiloniellales bacterium]